MARWFVGAIVLAVLVSVTVSAQDKAGKKKPKLKLPVGVWTREAGDARIQFTIRPRKLVAAISHNNEKLSAFADIGFTRDGHLFGRIARVKPAGTDHGPKVGELFSFRYQVKGNKMTISELRSPAGGQEAREVIEGEYTLTKKLPGKRKKNN